MTDYNIRYCEKMLQERAYSSLLNALGGRGVAIADMPSYARLQQVTKAVRDQGKNILPNLRALVESGVSILSCLATIRNNEYAVPTEHFLLETARADNAEDILEALRYVVSQGGSTKIQTPFGASNVIERAAQLGLRDIFKPLLIACDDSTFDSLSLGAASGSCEEVHREVRDARNGRLVLKQSYDGVQRCDHYDFNDRERVTLFALKGETRNSLSGTVTSFDALSPQSLQKAFNIYAANGGRHSVAYVMRGDEENVTLPRKQAILHRK